MASMEAQLEEQFDKEMASVKRPNLMIVGGTGVGKSSLINHIFGKTIAKVGTGQPVTRGCHRYEDANIPLVIFDTEGYEVTEGKPSTGNFREKIIPEIKQRKFKALDEQIHLIWYCLTSDAPRVSLWNAVIEVFTEEGKSVNEGRYYCQHWGPNAAPTACRIAQSVLVGLDKKAESNYFY